MKKRKLIYFITFFGVILIVGYLLMNTNRWISSSNLTYIETIQFNWDIILPIPNHEKKLLSNRGWMGDGDAITELYYEQPMDIQKVQGLSNRWVNDEELIIEQLPSWVQNLVNSENIDQSAKYFYLQKASHNYIVFKLNGNKLTIYESYL